jgi:Alpha/beta hydrolase family
MRLVDWIRPRHLHRAALWLMMVAAGGAWAQVIQVEPTNKGFFASTSPTTTFLFEAADARGTLIFIPGGEGRVGMRPGMTADHRYFSAYHFNVMLRSLAESTGGTRFNVVIFDSPVDLPNAQHWSGARTTTEHLSRVEDVIRHYRERLGKPVWLMGHSMGSISVTELFKRLNDAGATALLVGLIVSGGQSGTSLPYEATRLPVLLLHHEKDECPGNTLAHARRLHERLRAAGNTSAELAIVSAGTPSPDSSNACRSGYHMYYGAGTEVAAVLDRFMTTHTPAR